MGTLRVIAGKARGHKLRTVPGDLTRPITDRTKESLFNILGGDVQGAAFLDLFAGTGAVGIEALSRGADFVLFNDKQKAAVNTVRQNLQSTGLASQAQVLQKDAFRLLESTPTRTFEYIYIAPPQYKDMWKQALLSVDAHSGWMSADAWVIVQIHPIEYQAVALLNLVEIEQRKYGSTLLIFYERTAPEAADQEAFSSARAPDSSSHSKT